MASRRDQLNAYTFAKRRLLAAYAQSSPTGSEEGAPKPLRAVVPGTIVGVVVMAVFGAWGMFRPTAPQGWDEPAANVIVADKSTTRYVVLKTDGVTQLHPVLNMASAKLLLKKGAQGDVVTVSEKVLDSGKLPHGVTIGIPYAPDRLPEPSEAGGAKRWAVCERPSAGGSVQKAALVLDDRDRKKTEGAGRLRGGQLLYVADSGGDQYVVDRAGKAYPVDGDDELLLRAIVGSGHKPQQVSEEWLATLHRGDPVTFPSVEGTPGTPAEAGGGLDETTDRVGMVLEAFDNNKKQHYVVLPGRVAPITDFVARLLLFSKQLARLGQGGQAHRMSPGGIVPGESFAPRKDWPTGAPTSVNDASGTGGARSTLCNLLLSVDPDSGHTTLGTWAGKDFPARLATGSSSAYVTPGSGQLYRQFHGTETKAGPVFLVTDTGLRYVLQSNADAGTDDAGVGMSSKEREEQRKQTELARQTLGYAGVEPAPVPAAWSEFLPTGPRLSTSAARQPQGS
ncbi:MAG TPA: type VII secretion protein EccB [Streptomyces sp.]|nr:type VII secretion protein EccB [Streptomyces sp.]